MSRLQRLRDEAPISLAGTLIVRMPRRYSRLYSRSLHPLIPAQTLHNGVFGTVPLARHLALLHSLSEYDTVLPQCASSSWEPERPAPTSHTFWSARGIRSPVVTGTSTAPIISSARRAKFRSFR